MLRKLLFVTILIVLLMSILLSGSTFYNDGYTAKAILTDTPLYVDSNMDSEVLIKLPKNVMLKTIGEPFYVGDIYWQKVEYTAYTGYVLFRSLYFSKNDSDYNVIMVRAKASGMGEKIMLYSSHDISSAVAYEVNDGEKLRKVVTEINYGGFSEVEYENGRYFVQNDYITTGLSYNQIIAVSISAALIGVVVFAIVVIMLKRKSQKNK